MNSVEGEINALCSVFNQLLDNIIWTNGCQENGEDGRQAFLFLVWIFPVYGKVMVGIV